MLGPDVGYVDVLNHLTEEASKKAAEEGKYFNKTPLRPSAAGKCTRELAYELMEFHKLASYPKEAQKAELTRLFDLGHSIEYHLLKQMQQYMGEIFQVRYKQQSLSFAKLDAVSHPDMSQWLEGSIDLVLWSEKFKCVADVKSKKVKYSSYRADDWEEYNDKLQMMRSTKEISKSAFWVEDLEAFLLELNDAFFAANFLQLNLYACNPFLKERGIDHAAIFQYAKNDSRLREIRFKPSQKVHDMIVAKMQTALNAVDQLDLELAPKDFNIGSIKCAFCNYKKNCWPEDDALKLFFKTLPAKRWPKDTSRLDLVGEELEALYDGYKIAVAASDSVGTFEEAILNVCSKHKIDKLRFSDGAIYEVKLLKSPREHLELRKSKL